jgi:hypothetical protein
MNRWMGLAAAVMLAACGDEAVTVEQADGVTVEDVGGDAPDIGAPDVRVDDTGANPADVVQSETGVDAGPDAVVDDAGDVVPDVRPGPDRCLGPFDAAARAEGAAELIHVAAFAAVGTCAREGLELDTCPTELVSEELAITPGCAGCAAELASCAAVQCYETCGTDPAGPECGWCYRQSGCEEAYAECSGLEPWAWAPVCGARRYRHNLVADCAGSVADPTAFASCVRRNYEVDGPADACVEDCLIPYQQAVAVECPQCISAWCGSECLACVLDSNAGEVAAYCAGTRQLANEDEVCP